MSKKQPIKAIPEDVKQKQQELLEKHFKDAPTENDKLACLGVAYLGYGDIESALNALNSVLEADNSHLFALQYRAKTHHLRKEDDLAEADARAALKIDKNSIFTLSLLAGILFKQKRCDEAETYYVEILEKDSTKVAISNLGACYFHQKRYQETVDYFTKVFKEHGTTAYRLEKRAAAYEALKQYEKAAADYTLLIERHGETAERFEKRAMCYLDAKQYQLALEDMNKAVELGGETIRRVGTRGNIHLQLNNYLAAVSDFNWVIEKSGDSTYRNVRRADALNKLGRYREALLDANIAVKLSPPKLCYAHNVRGQANMGLGNFAEAVIDFTNSIEIFSQSTFALSRRGAIHLMLGRLEKAEADLKQCNNNAYASKYLTVLNRTCELIKDRQDKINYMFGRTPEFVALGEAYLENKMYKEAVTVFSNIIKQKPNHLEAFKYRAQAYSLLGETERAESDSQSVIRLEQENKVKEIFNSLSDDFYPVASYTEFSTQPTKTTIASVNRRWSAFGRNVITPNKVQYNDIARFAESLDTISLEIDALDKKVKIALQNFMAYAGKLQKSIESIKLDDPFKTKVEATQTFLNTVFSNEALDLESIQEAFEAFERADKNRGTGFHRVHSFFMNKRYKDEKGHSRLVKSTMGELVHDLLAAIEAPQVTENKCTKR